MLLVPICFAPEGILALRVCLKSPDSNLIYGDSFPQAVADPDVMEAAETAHDRLCCAAGHGSTIVTKRDVLTASGLISKPVPGERTQVGENNQP